jgi:hypothetical protein
LPQYHGLGTVSFRFGSDFRAIALSRAQWKFNLNPKLPQGETRANLTERQKGYKKRYLSDESDRRAIVGGLRGGFSPPPR